MRITKQYLSNLETWVNEKTKKVNVKVSKRYGCYAIDICTKDNKTINTLAAGLSKSDVVIILSAILCILEREQQ